MTSVERSTEQRCKCGRVAIPNGGGCVVTANEFGERHHYFDRCADLFVYDEFGPDDTDPYDAIGESPFGLPGGGKSL